MPTTAQFRVFVAVAKTGGIRAAADRVGRTPSAVSMTLKQLEKDVGGELFEGERKARLTRFGQFVLDQAINLIEHDERAHRTIGAFAHDSGGSVEIALLPSIGLAFLPDALKAFTHGRTNASVQIRDLDTNAVLDAVSHEIVDWGLASYHPMPQVQGLALFSEPLNVVCAADDPLCDVPEPIQWESLAGRMFIANGSHTPITAPGFRRIVDGTSIYVRSTLSLLSVVRAGVGITVLPGLSRLGGSDGLRFLTVDDPSARRIVHLLTRTDRKLSPAAAKFAVILRQTIADHADSYGLEVF